MLAYSTESPNKIFLFLQFQWNVRLPPLEMNHDYIRYTFADSDISRILNMRECLYSNNIKHVEIEIILLFVCAINVRKNSTISNREDLESQSSHSFRKQLQDTFLVIN